MLKCQLCLHAVWSVVQWNFTVRSTYLTVCFSSFFFFKLYNEWLTVKENLNWTLKKKKKMRKPQYITTFIIFVEAAFGQRWIPQNQVTHAASGCLPGCHRLHCPYGAQSLLKSLVAAGCCSKWWPLGIPKISHGMVVFLDLCQPLQRWLVNRSSVPSLCPLLFSYRNNFDI